VSRPAEAGWNSGPEAPATAAPLRAVETWQAERAGSTRTITVRVGVRGYDGALRGIPAGPVVLPGIFMIETLCQAMALAISDPDGPPVLRALRSVRYLAPVPDGDELTLRVTASPGLAGGWDVAAEGTRRDGTTTTRIRAEFGPGDAPPETEPPRTALYENVPPRTEPPGERAPVPAPLGTGRPVWDHAAIRTLLPQRHPLLLVDQVLALEPGRTIRAVKAITGTEPCYAHLTDEAAGPAYAYPRSLLIGSFFQTAVLLWMDGRPAATGDDRILLAAALKNSRFEGAAYPGDVLRHEARLDYLAADTAFVSGETWVADRRVAVFGTFIGTRRPIRPSRPAAGRRVRSVRASRSPVTS
jgi:3-hydroxymyristoyl/3-hydroxydecanoyl-(acyl carrier protein) dehydratase